MITKPFIKEFFAIFFNKRLTEHQQNNTSGPASISVRARSRVVKILDSVPVNRALKARAERASKPTYKEPVTSS